MQTHPFPLNPTQTPNPAVERTGSGRHAGCLRSHRAALRLSLTFLSLGVFRSP
jgi:hypothetical protein